MTDEFARAFQTANVKNLMDALGNLTGQQDRVLHSHAIVLVAHNRDRMNVSAGAKG